MKFSKLVSIVGMMTLALGVASGCGGAANSEAVKASTTSSESTVNSNSTGSKTLVVYFSATGNSKAVAEKIATKEQADVFEIVPKKPYSNADLNYNDKNSRVYKEHDDVSLQNIELAQVTPANWANYDTVFIGYPIWWGIAAWPVNTFVKGNDFSGKKVIPFCTSAVSGVGSSASNLQSLANGGDWQAGVRFSSRASDDEINEWLATLAK